MIWLKFVYPFLVSIITIPIFYYLIDRIGGIFFISLFLSLFCGSILVYGLITKIKHTLYFTLLLLALSLLAYAVTMFTGVISVNYLISIVIGNIVFAIGLSTIDYLLYGHKLCSFPVYLLASLISIIGLYLINIYCEGDRFALAYSVIIYCYLQASVISHHLIA